MSFALTTKQVRNKTKDVTRRLGWWNLKPGDIVNACVKCMGLKKGEKVEMICQIRIISTRKEPLFVISRADIIREGFPGMEQGEFVEMFCKSHKGCLPQTDINRIEFEYV